MYLSGHIKSSATANAVDTRTVPPPAKAIKKVEPFVVKEPEIVVPTPVEALEKQDKPATAKKGKGKSKPKEPEKVKEEEKPVAVDVPVPAPVEEKENPKPIDMSSDFATCAKYADMVGIKCEEIINLQLYKFIDKWYGTNYRLGGQTEKGVDCSGFTQKLYGEVYSMELTRTAQDQYKSSERVKHSDDAEEGDLVFFKQRGKRITHVGVYLANDFFIHSSTSQGVIISSLNEDYWHEHYVGIGKMQRQ